MTSKTRPVGFGTWLEKFYALMINRKQHALEQESMYSRGHAILRCGPNDNTIWVLLMFASANICVLRANESLCPLQWVYERRIKITHTSPLHIRRFCLQEFSLSCAYDSRQSWSWQTKVKQKQCKEGARASFEPIFVTHPPREIHFTSQARREWKQSFA